MKFMKLSLLFAILILSQVYTSFLTKRKSKKLQKANMQTKGGAMVFRNDYYGVCIVHQNCSGFSNFISERCDCDNMKISPNYSYNCNDNMFKKLESNDKITDPLSLASIKDIPLDLKKRLMKNSSCTNPLQPYNEVLEKIYGRKITSTNKMRIILVNGFTREFNPKKNFIQGEDVLVHAAIGKGMDFKFVVEQLNLSQNLMARSIASGLPNPNRMDTNALIDDLINEDLMIQKANLYIEKMFIAKVYHQILYVCAKGSKSAYHFTFDRSMRDHTHENIHALESLKRYTLMPSKAFRTLIRVVYFAKSDTCDDSHLPSDHFYSPKKDIIAQGKYNNLDEYQKWIENPNSDFTLKGSLMKDVSSNKMSFKKLYTAVQRYAMRYKFYIPHSENCQHFATGFYNYLTNQDIPYVNNYLMGDLDPEPFSNFFTNESDAEYFEQVVKRREFVPKGFIGASATLGIRAGEITGKELGNALLGKQ